MVNRFLGVLLVPIYTRILSPNDYGTLGLINTTVAVLGIFVVFSLDSASARWFFDTEDVHDRKKTMSTWFTFQFILSAIACVILIVFAGPLSSLILELDEGKYFIIPACALLTTILPFIITSWYRYQRRAWPTVIFTFSNSLLNIGLNLLFLLYFKMGIMGILYATLLSSALASVYVVITMNEWISFRFFSKERLREMLKFAGPMVPTSAALWILNSASTYILSYYWGKSEVGIFQLGMQIASIVNIVIGAFTMAWPPFAFSILGNKDVKSVFAAVFIMYASVMSFMALGIAIFTQEALIIFTNPNYYSATFVAGLLCFNGIIYGSIHIAVVGLGVAKNTKPIAKGILIGSLVTFILFFVLVPPLGKIGAAFSTIVGYLIVPILIFKASNKVYPVPYKFGLALGLFALAFGFFIVHHYFLIRNIMWQDVLIKVGILTLYSGLAGFMFYKNYPLKFMAGVQKVRNIIGGKK